MLFQADWICHSFTVGPAFLPSFLLSSLWFPQSSELCELYTPAHPLFTTNSYRSTGYPVCQHRTQSTTRPCGFFGVFFCQDPPFLPISLLRSGCLGKPQCPWVPKHASSAADKARTAARGASLGSVRAPHSAGGERGQGPRRPRSHSCPGSAAGPEALVLGFLLGRGPGALLPTLHPAPRAVTEGARAAPVLTRHGLSGPLPVQQLWPRRHGRRAAATSGTLGGPAANQRSPPRGVGGRAVTAASPWPALPFAASRPDPSPAPPSGLLGMTRGPQATPTSALGSQRSWVLRLS